MDMLLHELTLKWLGHFFSKCDFIFWCCSPYVQYFFLMKLVQYSECLVSIVDTEGLVHQGIGSHNADYAPMRYSVSKG